MTNEEFAKLERAVLAAVDDVNGLAEQWTEEGVRVEVQCAAFLGWLAAFAANGPRTDEVLEGLVDNLRAMTADRKRRIGS